MSPDGPTEREQWAQERYALDCDMDELLLDEADTDYGVYADEEAS